MTRWSTKVGRRPQHPVAEDGTGFDLGIEGLGLAQHVGRGDFADVYRAEQLSLRRTVAVKVLRAQASKPEVEARFKRECHAIGAVSDHPHIVGVHQSGSTRNGRAYLVMEYFPGGSLADRLAQDGALPVRPAVEIAAKIARALGVAHQAGVLHRDVKPANIMVSAYGEPALGDFGIARIEGGHQTTTGLLTASIVHAAPEILEGLGPQVAGDVYSLGSTLYELLIGKAPYYNPADESMWPLMKRILSEPMPSPEGYGVPAQLSEVLRRATNRDPADRFQSADEFAQQLEALVADPSALSSASTPGEGPKSNDATTQVEGPLGPVATRDAISPRADLTAVQAVPAAAVVPTPQILHDSPMQAHPQPPESSSGGLGRTLTLFLATITALMAIAAAAWFVLLPALNDDGTGEPEGAFPLDFTEAAVGPLDARTSYAIRADVAPSDLTFRLLVDGEPVTGSADAVPDLIPPAGRHQVVVEATNGDGAITSEPVDFIAVETNARSDGMRVHLARVDHGDGWPQVIDVYDALIDAGHTDVEVIDSGEVVGMAPGAWLLTVGGFDDGAGAEEYCGRFDLSVPDRCYAAPITIG